MSRVGDLPFCPQCGFDHQELDAGVIRSEPVDPLLAYAVTVVQEYKLALASMLQRRLKTSHPRAARLIDELEARGYIGPLDGTRTGSFANKPQPRRYRGTNRRNPLSDR